MTGNMNNLPKTCDRCAAPLRASTMSKFNRDIICMPCKTDEKAAPGYPAADLAEVTAVRSGDHNFPGVGLSAEDTAFLTSQLKSRTS